MKYSESVQEKNLYEEEYHTDDIAERNLILHNDDIHTFDFVIETLIDVCKHQAEQAEQCAYIVHYKGKCDIHKGTYNFLKPMKDKLINKGLNATID